jgi:DNA-binding NarL/FixJ family response regulator
VAATILVISDALLVRQTILEVLRRARFKRVVAIAGAQVPGWFDAGGGDAVALAFVDLHNMDRVGTRNASRELLAALRARWPRISVAALGWELQLAAHSRLAEVLLPLRRADGAALVQVARAATSRPRAPGPPACEQPVAPWPELSARERQVLDWLSIGADNLKIAAQIGISERSVKAHITNLFRKLGVENPAELALLGREAGFGVSPVADPPFRADARRVAG